jgi:hypothetical protein
MGTVNDAGSPHPATKKFSSGNASLTMRDDVRGALTRPKPLSMMLHRKAGLRISDAYW